MKTEPNFLPSAPRPAGEWWDTVTFNVGAVQIGMVLVSDGEALVEAHFASGVQRPDEATRDDRVLVDAVSQLEEYAAGERKEFDLPLRPSGSPFQLDVWETLLDVGYGSTTSYGELASAAGRPGAARAVGSAMRTNPIAIIVPCHRVIGSGGSLTGYGGGLDTKVALLQLEGAA